MAEIHDNGISTPGTNAAGGAGGPGSGTGGTGSGGGMVTQTQERAAAVADQATTEASSVKDHALQAASDVTEQARGELTTMTDQARQEARTLTTEARERLSAQADGATRQLADTLADIGGELRTLAERSDQPDGPATGVVRQLADRTESFAHRLETGGYRGIADDVARYGRNNPGVFLVAAGAAGFLVGRMLRNTDTQTLTQSLKGESGTAHPDRGPDRPAMIPAGVGASSRTGYATGSFTPPGDTGSGGYQYGDDPIDLDRPAYDTPTTVEQEAPYETETYAPPLGGPGSGRM